MGIQIQQKLILNNFINKYFKIRRFSMNKIADFLASSLTDRVYIAGDTLWAAYRPHSGMTMRFKPKGYITTKSDDSNYNSIAFDIVEYSKKTTPLMVKDDSKLFKIPVYKSDHIDAYKNTPEPDSFYYMIVNNNSVINFFKTKTEATNWLKTTAK